jgi:fructokinase
MSKLYCFGEVLWDLFPSGAKPGGAPMNVAIHGQNLGLESAVISAIGRDEYGDMLLHGSLATRNNCSYESLKALRTRATTRVFDLNLRAPFIDSERILELLVGTEIVKVNEEEYELLAHWLQLDPNPEQGFDAMRKHFGTQELIVTRGGQGALWINSLGALQSKVFPVTVKDTVGAGDSFLAAMLYGISHFLEPQLTLDYAAALGAMVASKEGANPVISKTELKAFIGASAQ